MAEEPKKVEEEKKGARNTALVPVVTDATVDLVMRQVADLQMSGRLQFPANYSPQNALMSAWLILQKTVDKNKQPVLKVCTRESIANALLDMVVQGLNPTKRQGYFIAYGSVLVFQRSYFGTITVTKRVTAAQNIYAEVVYENDAFHFELEGGNTFITKHERKLENIDRGKIKAAYCVIVMPDSEPYCQIMTLDQIHQAWKKSQFPPFDEHGQLLPNSTHALYAEEMCKKTVVNRTCKMYVNTSMDDSLDLVVEHMRHADEAAEEGEIGEEIATRADGPVIDAEFKPTEGPAPEGDSQPPGPKPPEQPPAKKRREPDF